MSERASIYHIGQALFVDLRAFLCGADIDPNKCRVIIEFPSDHERGVLVDRLRQDSPPIGQFGRASSAQAGNHGGKWQGVAYEFRVPEAALSSREDVIEECARQVDQVRVDRDAYERRMAGWDDPSLPDDKRRSWHNPAAVELRNAAQRIRSLKQSSGDRM